MSLLLDDIWLPGAAGTGALLMSDPSLPRDPFGHPYQVLYWFDADQRPMGLVVDSEGHALAAVNNDEGDPLAGEARCERMPESVEAEAWRWWSEQQQQTSE